MPRSCRPRSASKRRPLVALIAALGPLLVHLGPGAAVTPATHTVVIEAMVYQPADLTVRVGDTVVWRNQDPFPHTATSSAFDSGSIPAGGSWTYRARGRGEFPYVCTLHPTMKAILRVQ